jgi:hypothetical protein
MKVLLHVHLIQKLNTLFANKNSINSIPLFFLAIILVCSSILFLCNSFKCSAKTGLNIEAACTHLVTRIAENIKNEARLEAEQKGISSDIQGYC